MQSQMYFVDKWLFRRDKLRTEQLYAYNARTRKRIEEWARIMVRMIRGSLSLKYMRHEREKYLERSELKKEARPIEGCAAMIALRRIGVR